MKKTTQIKLYLLTVIIAMYVITTTALYSKAYEQAVFAFTYGSACFLFYFKALRYREEVPSSYTYTETLRVMCGKSKEYKKRKKAH